MFLLADANIQGHVERLVARMQKEAYIGFWEFLELSCLRFADLGLDPADSDAVVWRRCQENQALLVTNNRNDDGLDSLESTIRSCNTPQSLPVFTIADADRTLHVRDYSDSVIRALPGHLMRMDGLLGTGRLFVP